MLLNKTLVFTSLLLVCSVSPTPTNGIILKTFIHAHNQVIAQHDGDYTASRYFYLHDRLGSIRALIDTGGDVVSCYLYNPWGLLMGQESDGTKAAWYNFAGYWTDGVLEQHWCFKRQYDIRLGRFTSRDPVCGDFKEPMSLHPYLYCQNDWINRTDPSGELWGALRYAYRVVRGIEAYYTALDVGLQMAGGDPMRMLDAVIAVNTFRGYLFDPETLNRPFAWEIALRNLPSDIGNLISGSCDWADLGGCMLPVISEFAATTLAKEVSGYSAAGKATCAACAIEPTKASCVLCAAYITIEAVSNAKTINDTVGCFRSHCGN